MKRRLGPGSGEESEECALAARPRVSEAYSDSTCDSGAMEVQRIHSGLPVLPASWKTEGACEAPVDGGPGLHGHRSDGSDSRAVDSNNVVNQGGGRLGVSVFVGGQDPTEALQKCAPQTFDNASQSQVRQIIEHTYYNNVNRWSTPAEESVAVRRTIQHAGGFTALTKAALQQQMVLLEGDEQSLLAELRTLRREYDVRVAVLQQQQPGALPSTHWPAGSAACLPHPAPPLPLQQHSLSNQHRLQLVGTVGRHPSQDVGLAGPGWTRPGGLAGPGQAAVVDVFLDAAAGVMRGRPHDGVPQTKGTKPQPTAQRWTAAPPVHGARQDRPRKPPIAVRPNVYPSQPCGVQAAAPAPAASAGACVRRGMTSGALSAPNAPLPLSLTSVEGGGSPGSAAPAVPGQFPPEVLEALLGGGSGEGAGGALVGNLLTQLLQRGHLQPGALLQ